MLRIFIGWDQREPIAYDVAKYSIEKRASVPVDVQPIKLQDLVARGAYSRAIDPLASTEFTYSRFFTPYLAGFKGWALFVDCDFLFLGDVAEDFESGLPVVRVNEVHERPGEQLVPRVAERPLEPRIDGLEPAVHARDADHVGRHLEDALRLVHRGLRYSARTKQGVNR